MDRSLTLNPMLCSTCNLSNDDFPFERPEDHESKFDYTVSEVKLSARTITDWTRVSGMDIPFTLTSPVPCPINPSEDSSKS